jgi:hypothetical protein
MSVPDDYIHPGQVLTQGQIEALYRVWLATFRGPSDQKVSEVPVDRKDDKGK